MSYEKINFKNREVEKPLTFKKHQNDDGTITLEPKPGTIVEEGTPLLADHFNHMDDGIYKAHEEIDNLKLSGIERNKELVANLNSKKVSATTNDSLKTNIAKIKDIKLGSGNAVASDVLQGKTFSSSQGTDLVGTNPNNGTLSKTITTQGGTQKISPGYYSGGEVKAQFANLSPGNIKKGVNIGGVIGTVNEANISTQYIQSGTTSVKRISVNAGSCQTESFTNMLGINNLGASNFVDIYFSSGSSEDTPLLLKNTSNIATTGISVKINNKWVNVISGIKYNRFRIRKITIYNNGGNIAGLVEAYSRNSNYPYQNEYTIDSTTTNVKWEGQITEVGVRFCTYKNMSGYGEIEVWKHPSEHSIIITQG